MDQKKKSDALIVANKELISQNKEIVKRTHELTISINKHLETEAKLNKINRLYSFISQINKTITHVRDEQKLYKDACRIAHEQGEFKIAWIGKADCNKKKINLIEQYGISSSNLSRFSNTPYEKDGPQDFALTKGNTYICNDVEKELKVVKWRDFALKNSIRSCAVLPLKKSGIIIGTFNLYSTDLNFFDEKEIQMLKEVADDISFGLELIEKEQKQRETEILIVKNEKRFRALIEHSSDMVTISGPEGTLLYGSPSITRVLGYSIKEYLNLNVNNFIHPDDALNMEETLKMFETPGMSLHVQQRLKHKNGNWIWCEGTITNMLGKPGIDAIVSNFRDISEKKMTEIQREFETNNLNALINNTNDLMWSVDRDFNLITSNKPFEKIVEINFGKSIAKGEDALSAAYTPEMRSHFKKLYERAFSGEAFTETEYFDLSSEVWTEISYSPISKGTEIIGTACHSRDITNIKKAEKQIKESESFILGILNALHSHIAVIDVSGKIVAVNKSWKQFAHDNGETTLHHTGVGSNYYKVCKKSAKAGDTIAAEALKGIIDVMENRKKAFYLEYPCHSADTQRWFGMHALKLDSSVPMIVVAHMNITERKLAEEKLIVTNDKLNNTLKDLNKIMESSSDIICTIDEFGRFVNVSAASNRILGYTPNELKGKKFIDFVFIDDVEKTIKGAEDIMSGVSFTAFENRYVHKKGNVVPIMWSAKWDKNDKLMFCIARDATEKKKLEKALENERQRFYDLFSEAPSSMGVLSGPNHVFEFVNPLYLKLIGKKDIIGKTVKEVLPEAVNQGFIELLDGVYKTGKTFTANEMCIKLDSDRTGQLVDKYLNFMYQAHRTEGGKIDGILFFAVDVTEQVVLRKKIEDSETKLKEAQAIAHLANWEIDMVNNISIWSDEFYEIFGIKKDEMQPSPEAFISLVHPEDAGYTQRKIQKAFETLQASSYNFRFIHKDGTIRYCYTEWKFEFDTNKNPIRLYGILQDVTDQKEAELLIKDSEARLTEAQAVAKVGSWKTDLITFEVLWSAETYRIFEINTKTFIASHKAFLEFVHPDDRAKVDEVFVASLSKDSINSAEHRIVTLSGNIKIVEERWKIIKNKQGTPIMAVGTCQDITERKMAETEREKMISEMLQRNRDLEQFSYIISHNLRAPTANIIGFAEYLQDETLTQSEQKEFLEGLSVSVTNLDTVIKDINKILQVKQEADDKKEIVSFSKLVDDISISIGNLIDKNQVQIIQDFSEIDEIFTHKAYLYSIFYNLISNSIKYRRPDVPPLVEIESKIENEKIVLRFKDNGLGIDMSKNGDKVFKLYKRFHLHVEGKGMGLFMVKTQVEAIGGTISIESKLNQGTEFTIVFDK